MINLEAQFGIVLVEDTTGIRIDRIVSDTQARKRLDFIANPVNFPMANLEAGSKTIMGFSVHLI